MFRPRFALGILALLASATMARSGEPAWKQHAINDRSIFEAAGVFDVDGDGKLDIVSGDTWYKAPDWTPAKVRDVQRTGTYTHDFATLPVDVNGDGKTDFATVSYFGQDVGWVENPGEAGKTWTYHEIAKPGPSEAAAPVDLTGDGVPEVLPNTVTKVVWYEFLPATHGWKEHDFGTAAASHGVGSGDVNGDGRVDLITPKGWFEGPAKPTDEVWAWHPDWKDLGATGIQILAKDVDGDGLSDLIYGMGHDFGLYWIKQEKGPDGKPVWGERKPIDETISSVHTLLWADLNGDGKDDELISGKRVYAHEKEAGDTEASVVAWYDFDKTKGSWTRHVIFQGEPAKDAPADISKRDAQKDFPRGTAGTGLQMTSVDIDRDGDLDLVCPGKTGLYLFENLGRTSPTGEIQRKQVDKGLFLDDKPVRRP